MKKKLLMERKAALEAEHKAELSRMEAGIEEMTREQLAEAKQKIKSRREEIETIDEQLAMLEAAKAELQQQEDLAAKRSTAPAQVHDRAEDKPWGGVGEFLMAVRHAELHKGNDIDPRLRKLATGHAEGIDSEGGFLVGTDMATTLYEKANEEGLLVGRCAQQPISAGSNSLAIPGVIENTRANGPTTTRYGGIQTYWQGEAIPATASKGELEKIELKLKKITGLAYMTEELIQDAPAMQAYLERTFPRAMAFSLDEAIFEGDGVGKPLGFTRGGAVVAVAKEGAQAADTVVAANITKMYSRLPASMRRGAIWLVNQDVEPQLPLMTIGQMPVYLPPGGLAGSPYGSMYGLPVISFEHCSTVGDLYDIMLVNPEAYILATKGGARMDTSIHVKFIEGETAFRFVMRVDGQPLWKLPLTPKKSANTLSPFVALAERA